MRLHIFTHSYIHTNGPVKFPYLQFCLCYNTFLEYMFCRAKQRVEKRAAMSPIMSKLSSVTVAIITPPTIGSRDRYT